MTDTITREEIIAGLKRWAQGTYNTQAAVTFLADTDEPLNRPWVHRTKHSFTDETMYWLDWERFDKSTDGLSGGEYATWMLARSLHEGELNDNLWRLDLDRTEAFVTAIKNCRQDWRY